MIDDYATMLANEQNNANALLIQILGDNYEEWDFIVAVEGVDDRVFYFDFIKEFYNEITPKFFECGSKNRVLEFRFSVESYDWKTKPKVLYLCDKDFDDFLGVYHDGVFKTNVYSIESYFSGDKFVEYVLEKYCLRPLVEAEKSLFMDEFRSNFRRFMLPLRLVSALMCEIRASGLHPQFDNCGIEQLFYIGERTPTRRVRIIYNVIKILNVRVEIHYRSILLRARSFDKKCFRSWLRGKLALQVTRKVYELSRSKMSHRLREKIPASTYFGSEAFRMSKPFIGSVPGLHQYCLNQ